MFRPRFLVVALFAVLLGASTLFAGDVRIPLPKKSKYTPVQKLNRDGVTAVEKHQYDKAKKLFYKAYLLDPNDPFTLNNLGYLAELEGETDRAQRFYQLSSEQNSDAVVDKASNDLVEGKPVSAVAGNAEEKGIRVNRLNSQAIALLNKDRAPEADLVLQKALTIDSRNPFTLNNLGYAKEKEGELEAAYQFYSAAASTNSRERVEVSANKDWRGREISSVANDNAKGLRKRLRQDSNESRVAILNLRGVSAMNRNDRRAAREFIQQAYKLAPTDAFTLNNMGYLAEMDGDRETADYYYDRAREANQSGARVTLATRKELEGRKIGEVAENSDNLVLNKIDADRQARQRQGGPVILRRRDNTAVLEPKEPVSRPQVRVSDANGNLVLPPLPAMSSTPSNAVSNPNAASPGQGNPSEGGGLMMPLPENEQPTTVHQGETNGGLMMPLPDDQQPGAQPNQQQPQTTQPEPVQPQQIQPQPSGPAQPQQSAPVQSAPVQPAPVQGQPVPQQQQGPNDHGLLLPVPDNQQPGAAQPQTQPPQAQAAPPSNNTGVYTPPPVGASTTSQPPSPKRINDNDPHPSKTSAPSTSNSGVKKISDQ